jgi:hypothetical protein
MPDPVRELLDLVAVHTFYLELLESHLGHPIPVPHEVGQTAGGEARAVQSPASLKRWLNLLDLAITAPMVRDALKESAKGGTAEALLRYFVRKQSKSPVDRDKTDFVATFLYRCFAPGTAPAPVAAQPVRQPGEDFVVPEEPAPAFEADVYRVLEGAEVPSLPEEHRQLVREFQFLRQEVDDFRHFDELMDSGVMQRVRDIKQTFGTSFYHPRVLATLAEYNVSFGARFDALFHATTRQIKNFATRMQQEGGSIMSRVDGDVTVKHLAEVEENEILQTEYGRAQEAFRNISKLKKAVDIRGTRRASPPAAPIPAASAAAPAPAPIPAETAVRGGKDLIEESKLKNTADTIHNFMRAADPDSSRVVPLRHGNLSLSVAEAEAFRADYGGEKSFRAEYAGALRTVVALEARMVTELQDYEAKRNSAYLWKPHADSLAYLLGASERAIETCTQVMATAEQRGLAEKVTAMKASLQKLRRQAQTVAKILEGMA